MLLLTACLKISVFLHIRQAARACSSVFRQALIWQIKFIKLRDFAFATWQLQALEKFHRAVNQVQLPHKMFVGLAF